MSGNRRCKCILGAAFALLLLTFTSCRGLPIRPALTPTLDNGELGIGDWGLALIPTLSQGERGIGGTATHTPKPTDTATPTLTPLPSATPTPSPTPSSTPTPAPTATATQPPSANLLSPMAHEWQNWNNCGVVSAEMVLSYYGVQRGQYEIAPVLRPHKDDKHVGPDELVVYFRTFGLQCGIYVNGDVERLQALIDAGVPVLISTWLNDRPTGHYRVIRGYDRRAGVLILNDSYYGPEVQLTYAGLERVWAPFNHRYMPVYPPEKADLVCGILGPDCDQVTMYQRAADAARTWTEKAPNDPYAWFSLGDDLLELGDYEGAIAAYDRAQAIGLPEHMFWYRFGPFEACLAAGQYEQLLAASEAVLAGLPAIEELHMLRGQAFEALGQRDQAIEEYRLAFVYHTHYTPAVEALQRLGVDLPPVPTITPTPTATLTS